jgi:hypothetical protein
MKGKKKAETKPDPLRMKASEFDHMMKHALGVPPAPAKRKASKKKAGKKAQRQA